MSFRPGSIVGAILAVPLYLCPAAFAANNDAALRHAFADYMARMGDHGFSGAILVVKDGKTIYRNGVGMADREKGHKVTDRTLFASESLAKQFTSAGILKLESMGRLRVTDTLGAIFPNVPEDKRSITIHQLLTHTSGIRDSYDEYAAAKCGAREQLVESVFKRPLGNPIGAKWAYSNNGYGLLAIIIERRSGKRFQDFMHESILRPLGMVDTRFFGETTREVVAKSYGGEADLRCGDSFLLGLGSGNMLLSMRELEKWDRAIREHRVLPPAQEREWQTAYTDVEGLPIRYGYGWWTEKTPRGTRVLFHTGVGNGFSAFYRRLVDEGISIAFLSNVSMADSASREAFYRIAGVGPLERIALGMPFIMPAAKYKRRFAASDWDGIYRHATAEFRLRVIGDDRVELLPLTQAAFDAVIPQPRTAEEAVYRQLHITTVSPAQRVQLATQDALVANIFAAATRGDWSVFREQAGDDWSEFERPWKELTARYGVLRSARVLGSAPIEVSEKSMTSTTIVALTFANGEGYYQMRFWNGELSMALVGLDVSPVTPFIAVSPRELKNFQWYMQSEASIQLRNSASGPELLLSDGSVATRVSGLGGDSPAKREQGAHADHHMEWQTPRK